MSSHHQDHVEYAITSGQIAIAVTVGNPIPAYWSHPATGGVFPGVVLIHDWWGITAVERHLAHRLAQAGYYVVMPDLFDGETVATPESAADLVHRLGAGGYDRVDTALQALETHLRCNRSVAAIGLGMGGTLAFEAALMRDDLEAAVALYGFPQRFFGRFHGAKAPILALYGSEEPHVDATTRERLRAELAAGGQHRLMIVEGAGRDFFGEQAGAGGETAWRKILDFLDSHLAGPSRPPADRAL